MARVIKRILWVVLALVLVFYGVAIAGFVYLRFLPPLITGVQLQRQIESVFAGDGLHRAYRYRPADEISRHLPRAVVAAEDTRFFQHRGFDWDCIREQRERQRTGRTTRGCSTITQQLVKNLYLTTHRNWVRKGVEATLTPLAEVILGKERILQLYVNIIEWGPGVFGAEAAARHHYDRSASGLSREQSAGLAALIPAPRSRTPRQMGSYQRTILTRMRQMGW
jgi:monofunctional glycosyltransferase